ncbi:hypothetical protein [Nocardia niigatensis]|uniref:hypothetical protein n=1 Tax=Nocardia niigatensis TaxID=209249 RepID=UPI000594D518|nr:hypothetical protein [Nocardia niigatensis]
MEILPMKDSAPGELTTVRSESGEWLAVWMGDRDAKAGCAYQVELEIDEVEEWIDDDGLESFNGIKKFNGSTMVCGMVSASYDDGVIALDLNPGSVMVESDSAPRIQLGKHVCMIPASIAIYPTDT